MATYDAQGTAKINFWSYQGGWVKTASDYVSVYQTFSSGGNKTMYWTYSNAVTFGAGLTSFAVNVELVDGNSAVLSEFNRVYWTAQGSGGGVRSATPNGEKSLITVRPK